MGTHASPFVFTQLHSTGEVQENSPSPSVHVNSLSLKLVPLQSFSHLILLSWSIIVHLACLWIFCRPVLFFIAISLLFSLDLSSLHGHTIWFLVFLNNKTFCLAVLVRIGVRTLMENRFSVRPTKPAKIVIAYAFKNKKKPDID